jgi:prepilin signal peptidase PulO-like enzyme (type II secretory pathway)
MRPFERRLTKRGHELLYAATAVVATALTAASLAVFGLTGRGMLAALACLTLAILTAKDVAERRVPNRLVIPAAAVALAGHVAIAPGHALEWILGALLASTALTLLALLHPAGLGMGDAKLALLIGALLGRDVVLALLLGTMAAGLVGTAMIVGRGSQARKATLPLVPFLAIGTVVLLFAGSRY